MAVKLLQVTCKPNGKREYKQLDSVVKSKGADGQVRCMRLRLFSLNDQSTLIAVNLDSPQEVTMSHKCSDMEKLIPTLLGVSKPILDLVIFCHQEESLWPMSDSKALKDKFDDIFAATRYSLALVRIKKLRSEKARALLEMQGVVQVLENQVEQANKVFWSPPMVSPFQIQ